MLSTMQVHSASQPPELGGLPKEAGGGTRPGVTAPERAREKQLLAGLTVTVTPDPGSELLAAWDQLLARTTNSDVAQLSAWANIRRLADYEPLYLLATSGA